MYHPFDTKTECETALEALHYAMADVAAAHGFTIIPPYHVVGKNALTGEDNPASVTTKWSNPVELSDGRWGIPSFRSSFPTTYAQLEQTLPSLEDVAALSLESVEEDNDLDETYVLESVE